MTVTGGFPAPGPQDRAPAPHGSSVGPPPAGRPVRLPAPTRQMPMMMAHKPGIVALRPLQLGDILDGGVRSVRFNPKSMVGMSALVLAVFLVPSAALGIGATHLMVGFLDRFGPEWQLFLGFPSSLILSLFNLLAAVILSGLLSQAVGQAVLGRKPDLRQTWLSTRQRLLPLVGLGLLVVLANVLLLAVLVGPGVLVLVNGDIVAGVIVVTLGLLVLIPVTLAVSTKIALAGPAIVLEGYGVRDGLRRSFALTRGPAFWRVLGIRLVAGLLAGLVGTLLGLPLSILGEVIANMAGQGTENAEMLLTFISHLSALLTGAITTPFVAAVTCLIYVDRRMRVEALDVILFREAQSNPATGI
jgi:hypothetical protein